jgi:DNA mismatch repair ATPase MutS
MEAGIACQLTRRLAEHAAAIAAASEAVAELDCVLSLAQAARDLNLCRPQVGGRVRDAAVSSRCLVKRQAG